MDNPALSAETNKVIYNYYLCLINILKESNIDLSPLLKQHNLPVNLTQLSSHTHNLEQFYAVVKDAIKQHKLKGLGLQFGSRMKLSDYGILGYALLSCSNVLQAIDYGSKFVTMTTNQIKVDLLLEKNSAILVFHSPEIYYWPQPFLQEECLSESWNSLTFLLPELKRERPTRINLAFNKPDYAHLYKEMFQCPVYFNQPHTELHFPKKWLEKTINTANEMATQVCAQQCELIVAQLGDQGSMTDRVRRLILSQPMSPPLGLDDVAKTLLLSSRTLRERLYNEGTNYKEISNELRMKIAKEYLSTSELSTQEIAYLVGYQHSANFFRAFKKTFDHTPEQYRLACIDKS